MECVWPGPRPGQQANRPIPLPKAAPHQAPRRICTGLTALAAAAWPRARHLYEDSDFEWSDFHPSLLDDIRPAFPELPPAAVALALRIRGHLHGLVSLEIYGHMRTMTPSPDKLFQEELTQLLRALALSPHR